MSHRGSARLGAATALLALLVAGCGMFGGGRDQAQPDPYVIPSQPPAPAPAPQQHTGMGGDQAALDAAAKAELEGKIAQLLQQKPITFEPDSARLTSQGQQSIQQVGEWMTHSPGELNLEILGYTAPDPGSPTNAQELAQQRAQTVVDQLVGMGVPTQRLKATGVGTAPPGGGEPASLRRVDVKLL